MDEKDKTIESLKRQILMMWQGFEDGISGDEIDVSDTATTLSGVKILGLVQKPGNSHAAHADLRCFIAEAAHIN